MSTAETLARNAKQQIAPWHSTETLCVIAEKVRQRNKRRKEPMTTEHDQSMRTQEHLKSLTKRERLGNSHDTDTGPEEMEAWHRHVLERDEEEGRMMNEEHKCDTCEKEFATCVANKIVWGIDRYPEVRGKDADRVLECDACVKKAEREEGKSIVMGVRTIIGK